MLISTEVEMGINPENINRLEELGYKPRFYNKYTKKMTYKRGSRILIKVEHLTPSSKNLVEVKCDYCGGEKQITYKDYFKSLTVNDIIKKYCCINCVQLKKREIIEYKFNNNVLTRNDKGYWTFKENRLKELKIYIDKYETIHGIQNNKEGSILHTVMQDYGENIKDLCIELGYDYTKLLRFEREDTYYDNYDNMKHDIKELCIELGRFPKQQEVLSILHISNERLFKFDGIKNIKFDMGYEDKDDLVDDRGFYNRSSCEYMTAQYLITNNMFYTREDHPFEGKYKNYRSDFAIHLSSGEIIQIEVWGFPKDDDVTKRGIVYNNKRKLKEKLYKDNNYRLISIDYETFYKQHYNDILISLKDIFKDFIDLKCEHIEQEIIIPPNKFNDIELLQEIMRYGYDKSILPTQGVLSKNGKSRLFLEALKRYGTYYNFAKKYGKFTSYQVNKWNKNNIFDGFKHMLETYNHILKNNEYKKMSSFDRNITGLAEATKKHFGTYIDARLCFYEYCLDTNFIIQEQELLYLSDLINCKNGFNKITATKIRTDKAKYIVNKLRMVN